MSNIRHIFELSNKLIMFTIQNISKMKTSQLTENFKGQVLFQNNKYSIEMCDVLHLRNEFKTDKKQICVIVDKFKANWIRPNSEIDLLYLDFSLPQYIVDKTLSKIRKHKNQLFY